MNGKDVWKPKETGGFIIQKFPESFEYRIEENK